MEFCGFSPSQARRLQRIYSERFYVLHAEYDDALQNGALKISGSTGSVYTVSISAMGALDCDCPDSAGRMLFEPNVICKHRCFVLYKVVRCDIGEVIPKRHLRGSALSKVRKLVRDLSLGLSMLGADLSDPDLCARYERIISAPVNATSEFSFEAPSLQGSADDCAICYETLAEGARLACPQCKNTVHQGCIIRWVLSGNISCPFCRSSCWEKLDPLTGRAKSAQRDSASYVNVLARI